MAIRETERNIAGFLLVLVILGLFIRALTKPTITRNGCQLRKPPGTWPLVGNGIIFCRPRERLFEWFTNCVHLYGHETLRIAVPSLPQGVIISNPANLDYVFKHEDVFEKGGFFKDRLWDLFGNGILNVDGELWRRQRKAGSHFFTAATLRTMADCELPRLLEHVVEQLTLSADGTTVVDLEAVVNDITTQLMGKMAYGMEMSATDDFPLAFDYASGIIAKRFQNPLWFITELVTGRELRRSTRIMKTFGQRLVSHALAIKDSEEAADPREPRKDSGTFINVLFDALGDEKLVADSALNYLSAGKDTVAQALTWTFYLLMKHPEVATTLRRVARGGLTNASSNTSITEPEPAAASYIVATFYESLRLYPPLPFEIKQAQQDTTLPDGTFLPKNTIVVWCTWALNRSNTLWGSDAEEYRPERWLLDGRFVQRSASEFPVFQGGSRLCLGKKMAETIAVQVITTLATTFEFAPAYKGEKVSRTHLTLPMEGGLSVYVKRRTAKGDANTSH